MKELYLGMKLVKAEPAYRVTIPGEDPCYIEKSKATAELLQKIVPTGSTVEDGYRVRYSDGYVSWCPKAQFEFANMSISKGLTVTSDMVEQFIVSVDYIKVSEDSVAVVAYLRNGMKMVESHTMPDGAQADIETGFHLCLNRIREKVRDHLYFLLNCAANGVNVKYVDEKGQ